MNESKDTKRTTLVEEGTAFRGTFSSDCPIIVKGRIEGNITGPSLTVSSTGSVAGTVKVSVIESEGELSGEFEAEVVRLSGRVRDHTVIRAKSLEVKLTPEKGMMQVVFGECALDVGDMPSKEEVLGEARLNAAEHPAETTTVPEIQASDVRAGSIRPAEVRAGSIRPSEMNVGTMEASAELPPEGEKQERRNGFKGKGARSRNSETPPPS